MYSNGPVSIRRDFELCVAGSAMRSETQLHTWPSYSGSGCVVRRNWMRVAVALDDLGLGVLAEELRPALDVHHPVPDEVERSLDDHLSCRCAPPSPHSAFGELGVDVVDGLARRVVIFSASSSGIVKPYSCCMASWTSTKASESRPMSSKRRGWVVDRRRPPVSPTRSTRIRLRSSKVNVLSPCLRPPRVVRIAASRAA